MAILLDGERYFPPPPTSTYYGKTIKNNTPLIVNTPVRPGVGVNPRLPLGIGIEFDTFAPYYQNQVNQRAPTTSGGGGGGNTNYYSPSTPTAPPAPPPLTWSETYQIANAPSWWKGMTASQLTPETELASIMNALIPFMSNEDQRQFASNLSRLFPDAFGHYSPLKSNMPDPTPISDAQQEYFMSQKRAGDILSALERMRAGSGKSEKDFGPGYEYMKQLASVMKDYGAAEGYKMPSRKQMIDMYSAFDPLMAETQGEKLGAYGEVARSLAQPFFGAGKLIPISKTESGEWKFGDKNKSWF